MRTDVVLAGVGGRGVLSLGLVLANVAREAGLCVTVSEVHGMAQRGGSVFAHLRIADGEIHSALIPRGTADLVIAAEPLEGLRCLDLLGPDGVVVTSTEAHQNITDYPDPEELLAELGSLPNVIFVDTAALATEAGVLVAETADDFVEGEGSVAHRLGRVFETSSKPWVVVVDSGASYDAMVAVLERHGVPTFRSADRATRLLGSWACSRLP